MMKASLMTASKPSRKAHAYHSYLLRIWCENGNHLLIWRASLQSVQSQETVRFRSLAELCDYLFKTFLETQGKEEEG
jgi:hypothetical protein